jgi:hypothetical protein
VTGSIDLTGKIFGRWLVLAQAGQRANKEFRWLCRCVCSTERVLRGSSLRSGRTRSCGCLQRELVGARSRKHGLSRSPEYRSWTAMMARCYDPNSISYKYYGALGIEVCEHWHTFETFSRTRHRVLPGAVSIASTPLEITSRVTVSGRARFSKPTTNDPIRASGVARLPKKSARSRPAWRGRHRRRLSETRRCLRLSETRHESAADRD